MYFFEKPSQPFEIPTRLYHAATAGCVNMGGNFARSVNDRAACRITERLRQQLIKHLVCFFYRVIRLKYAIDWSPLSQVDGKPG